MQASAPSETDEEFVLETDQAPEFWQFLNGLRGDDLLVELIVNELDARSPCTEIRFEPDRLICVGSGDPVDAEGWARLRKIKGAGHVVKAKAGLFGVKNHGLKACFTIGNDILVRSDGKQILQTLFADGRSKPPYPGVRVPPRDDPDAPTTGTQIEIVYRRKRLAIPHGEALELGAVTDATIEAMFKEAVATLPKRLMGIVRAGILERYTFTLSHHALGSKRFELSCGRANREHGLVTFFRECNELAGEERILAEREQAALMAWPSAGGGNRPRFFHAEAYRVGTKRLFDKPGLILEVAWGVEPSGRLRHDQGRLRYPVAYPGQAADALTGMAVHYSGPFVSDTERHELAAQSSAWNNELVAACDKMLAKAMTCLLKRHRANALELIAELQASERLKALIGQLLAARALPAVDIRGAATPIKRGARLLVPTYLYSTEIWSEALAKIAPADAAILDPKTPGQLVKLLADGVCAGWNDNHLRFDEKDVVERLESPTAEHFPWRSDAEWRQALGQPPVAKAYLDALLPALTAKQPSERAPGAEAHLPDSDGRLHPLKLLKRGAAIPSELIGLGIPPTIHPALKGHPALKLEGWRLEPYAFRDMVREGGLAEKPVAVRKRFFSWLARNAGEVPAQDWPALKALPIWPAVDGSVRAFETLCLPDAKLAALLGDHIVRPSREVRIFCAKTKAGRTSLKLRDEPSADEVASFYRARLAGFPSDAPLNPGQRADFHAFERSLAALGRSKRAARALRSTADDARALSRSGMLGPVRSLVRETPEIACLRLQPKDLLDRPALELDGLLPPARKPSARAVLDALAADAAYADGLLPRLRIITASADEDIATELGQLPCILVEGLLKAPDDLAFKGNQGDFWGEWKTLISGAGLSDDAQDLYRAAGVIKSYPTAEASRQFFTWLNQQLPAVLVRNLDCVIRHIAHKHGVGAWLLVPPELPCIPVQAGKGVALLTLSSARKYAVVDDFPELAEAIRADAPNPQLQLAIHSVATSTQPIGDLLKEWGIPTLSSVTTGPASPMGNQSSEAPHELLATARALAAPAAAKRFRKQLHELDIPQRQLEPQFQKRLLAIRRVMLADALSVQYRARKRAYRARRAWAVLPEEIWLDAEGDLEDLLMRAVADLVFREPRPRYLSAVLKDALKRRAHDFQATHEEMGEDEDSGTGEEDDDVGEATHRHPGAEPDPSRNTPHPGKLYTGGGGVRNVTSSSKPRPQVVAEEIQRRQLKAEHYAYHCQMELAQHMPDRLAPVGSYAEFAENRSKIMEAHHPDKISASGSRHAGNLLILSRINHERIGTRLSRDEITEALRTAWTPHIVQTADGKPWLKGGIARTYDKMTGELLPLFFTDDHRAYWLEMAGEA